MQRWLLLAFFIFTVLLQTAVAASNSSLVKPTDGTTREAYVTLLYGEYYALPIRVMMNSLLKNSPDVASGQRDRLVLVTQETPERTVVELNKDGIKTRRVDVLDSPYKDNAKFDKRFTEIMTKLKIFGLMDYKKIVYIDADSLIFDDLSSLFTCGEFCATFINPCYFNAGMVVITPNNTLLEDMEQKMKTMKSYDGGDQGFLNTYFPDMLNAESFRPESGQSGGNVRRRLPFGWHVDHSSFYPRFSFDFSAKRCGRQKDAEFLGPAFAKPWFYWTYAVMDLSWEWHKYRKDLNNPYPLGTINSASAIWRIVVCYIIAFLIVRVSVPLTESMLNDTSQAQYSQLHLRNKVHGFSIGKRSYLLVAVVLGFVEWIGSLLVTVFLIPPILMPYHAVVLYIHVKTVSMTGILVVHGLILSTGVVAKYESDALHHRSSGEKSRDIRNVMMECWMWGLLDAVFLPVGLKVLWMLKFATMWNKIAHAFLAASFYFGFVLVMAGRLSLRWVRIASYWRRA